MKLMTNNVRSTTCVSELTQALKTVVKYSGISGLWMGLGSTLLRDVPFSAIYWLNYETIKKIFYSSQHTFTFNLAAGAVAGSVCISQSNVLQSIRGYSKLLQLQVAAFVTIPFDVVKTHRQIEMGEKEIYSGKY